MPKHPGGRPSKYDPKYCQEIIAFFDREPYRKVEQVHTNKKGETWSQMVDKPNDPPFLSAFAQKIGVNDDTLVEWAKVHPEFSAAITRARKLQEEFLLINGLKGITNPIITSLMLKTNHGYSGSPIVDQSTQIISFVQQVRRIREEEEKKQKSKERSQIEGLPRIYHNGLANGSS